MQSGQKYTRCFANTVGDHRALLQLEIERSADEFLRDLEQLLGKRYQLCRRQAATEILKPIGRHLGVSNRVHDIFVAHVVLKGSGVVPVVGKLVAGGVPEHVRMDREWELCGFSSPSDCLQESGSRGRTTALGNEYISRFHILAA
jgi:hypothetical protein